MELNQDKLQSYIDNLNTNITEFTTITDKVVKEQSSDLDEIMNAIKISVTQENAISTEAIEGYYAELTNLVYFMADRLGRLNIYKDMSKAMTKEAYNKAYLNYSMEKDEKGKSLRTVNENSALADAESKYQSIMDTVYANAYGILKTKYDMANEMISTLKNILKRRVSEMYINAQISGLKINNLGEDN